MTEGKEGYQPSEEEIKKAEEMMTPEESKLSEKRESLISEYESKMEEAGVKLKQGLIAAHEIYYQILDSENSKWLALVNANMETRKPGEYTDYDSLAAPMDERLDTNKDLFKTLDDKAMTEYKKTTDELKAGLETAITNLVNT